VAIETIVATEAIVTMITIVAIVIMVLVFGLVAVGEGLLTESAKILKFESSAACLPEGRVANRQLSPPGM
jgi:hypothetical protein